MENQIKRTALNCQEEYNPAYCFEDLFTETETCPWEEGCALEMPEEFAPSRGNVLDTISLSKEYKITFSLKANSFPPQNIYHSVFAILTASVGGESAVGLWIRGEQSTYVTFYNTAKPVSSDSNELPLITLGQWTNIEISSTLAEDGDINIFRVKINGQQVLETDNPDAMNYSKLRVWSGDSLNAPLNGVIKDFFVSA